MKRTLGIVFAAAVAGAFAGGLIGVLLDGGSDEATAPAAAASDSVDRLAARGRPRPHRRADLQPRRARRRRDQRHADAGRPTDVLHARRDPEGRRARLRLRHRQAGRHRHQQPRRPEREPASAWASTAACRTPPGSWAPTRRATSPSSGWRRPWPPSTRWRSTMRVRSGSATPSTRSAIRSASTGR